MLSSTPLQTMLRNHPYIQSAYNSRWQGELNVALPSFSMVGKRSAWAQLRLDTLKIKVE